MMPRFSIESIPASAVIPVVGFPKAIFPTITLYAKKTSNNNHKVKIINNTKRLSSISPNKKSLKARFGFQRAIYTANLHRKRTYGH